MPTAVVMPKQGQSVESTILIEWKVQPGATVAEGDILCEVETDKAIMEVPSPLGGTLLATFFQAGDEVPVLVNIAAIGAPGEDAASLRPAQATTAPVAEPARQDAKDAEESPVPSTEPAAIPYPKSQIQNPSPVSPRARHLSAAKQVDAAALQGSGPGGRVIERDVQAALAAQPRLSPVAQAMVAQGGYVAPPQGSGPGGRVMSHDLVEPTPSPAPPSAMPTPPPVVLVGTGEQMFTEIPVRGVRKVIADRMLASLQTTAQLTLNRSADARSLLAYRKRLKASDESLGLQGITINDLLLFAVSRILPLHPALNAHFDEGTIRQYADVGLGFAVDTPRGLIVPVLRRAQSLTLAALARESRRLAGACLSGTATPDDLSGGTFTVTNLGSLGVESFTPILNPPQVAILGVGGVVLKPVEVDGAVEFLPHLSLSLTINHQVVDGAPGARFLQALAQGLATFETLLAL